MFELIVSIIRIISTYKGNFFCMNINRSLRFSGMPINFRLCPGPWEKTLLSLRGSMSVGFPACMRIRRTKLQFAMSPATRSMSFSTATAHSLQGTLWIGYVGMKLSLLSGVSPSKTYRLHRECILCIHTWCLAKTTKICELFIDYRLQ